MGVETPRTRPDLRLIDENYVAKDKTTAEVAKAERAGLIKEGRRRAMADLGPAINTIVAGQTATIRKERDARPTIEQYHRHGWARAFQGLSAGLVLMLLIAGVGLAIYTRSVMDPAFDAAARMQMQQDVVSTLQRSAEP